MITLFLLKQTIITLSKTQLDTTYSKYGSLEEQYPENSLKFSKFSCKLHYNHEGESLVDKIAFKQREKYSKFTM